MTTYCPTNKEPFGKANYQHNYSIEQNNRKYRDDYTSPTNSWKRFQEKQTRLEESRW